MYAIFLTDTTNHQYLDAIKQIIDDFKLDLSIKNIQLEIINNKTLKKIATDNPSTPILIANKQLTVVFLDNDELIKVRLDWQSYQSRIIKAGKNSELLLKIAKLNADMTAIDGTAGFGIDGLLLASTGAKVILIEQNPLLFLLLILEKNIMSQNPNWQKLMARIDLYYGNSMDFLKNCLPVDLIYLDPMFPKDSYKSVVNKRMQILHNFIAPPSLDDESILLDLAQQKSKRLIVKRPISAPNFAHRLPTDTMYNQVIRFDRYDNHNQGLTQS